MARTRHSRALLTVLLSLSLVVTTIDVVAQTEEEVERAERDLEEAVEDLRFIEDDLDAAVTLYEELWAEVSDLEYRVIQLTDRMHQYEGEVGDLRQRARERAIEAYMAGGVDSLGIFLEAGSYSEVVTGQQLLEQAASKDIVMLDRLEVSRREMERVQSDLAAEQATLAELNGEMQSLVVLMEELWDEADADVDEADETLRAARAAYEEEQRRLRLAELNRRTGNAAGAAPSTTPGFICPVNGPNRFRDTWGAPRSGGRTHKGTDVFGARGTPLVAVGAGSVRLSSGGLGGLGVWLYADSGTAYYYAHLDGFPSGLSAGSRVQKGQVIGYLGNSGNARGGAHHLHFQLHPGGGAPVNPYPTLVRACG